MAGEEILQGIIARGLVMLQIRNASVVRSGRVIASRIDIEIRSPNLLFLVGSGGSGKTTVLQALSGRYADENIALLGTATFRDERLSDLVDSIVLLRQHLKLTVERSDDGALVRHCLHRHYGIPPDKTDSWLIELELSSLRQYLDRSLSDVPLSVARVLAVLAALCKDGDLYLLDEPTADIAAEHLSIVRQSIATLARRALVIFATHNRQDCLAGGGYTALLARGKLQEIERTERFFFAPTTPAGQEYVTKGYCDPFAAESTQSELGIWWVVGNLLCGMSRPGLVADADQQFKLLVTRGVRVLVCLEQRCAYPYSIVKQYGIAHYHFPVGDMGAPDFARAVDICRIAAHAIDDNRGVAFHCRGGLGRTGTLLAAVLIWHGESIETAIAKVRAAQPKAIQSRAQYLFLHDFAGRILNWDKPSMKFRIGSECCRTKIV